MEKMILGNKCDMTDKRTVSKERGETVSTMFLLINWYWIKNILNLNFIYEIVSKSNKHN